MASGSAPDAQRITTPELDHLELMVRRLLDAHDGWRRRAETAEARLQELTRAVADVSAGRLDPLTLEQRASELEARNRALRDRLNAAHEIVQRILGRLHFVEEER